MLSKIPSPAIIAHRGASQSAPENTVAAFAKAVEQAADAIELDAMLTRDQEVVVIHDSSVDRTTNGTGRVADLSLADIQQLDAGSFFDSAFSAERIPTLADILQTFAGTIPINIELKNYSSPWDDLPKVAARQIQICDCVDQIMFSSFNPIALLRARKQLPEVPIGLLAAKGTLNTLIMRLLQRVIPHEAIHPHYRDVNQKIITRAHANNRRVNTYTVNNKDTMLQLFDWNIDSIFTDDPVLALKTRADWRESVS
jgi:glycerophosphoryl diester phosphodiesterase